jgi:hypothetical protein
VSFGKTPGDQCRGPFRFMAQVAACRGLALELLIQPVLREEVPVGLVGPLWVQAACPGEI